MAVSRCVYCGSALRSGTIFCPKCGFVQQNKISAADRLNSLSKKANEKKAANTVPPAIGLPLAPPSCSVISHLSNNAPSALKLDGAVAVSANKTVKSEALAEAPRTSANEYKYFVRADNAGKSGNYLTVGKRQSRRSSPDNAAGFEAPGTERVYEINTDADVISGASAEELSRRIDRQSQRLSDIAQSLNRIERKIEDLTVSLRRLQIKNASDAGNALTRADVDAMLSFMRLIAANQLLNL